jgi:hypothetical protein
VKIESKILVKEDLSEKDKKNFKKLTYKIHRDIARLNALLRKPEKADEEHQKAITIFKEIFGDHTNVKLAKMTLIEGIWQTKFSYKTSARLIEKSQGMFLETIGRDSYFTAACKLEIANAQLKMNEKEKAK